MISVTKVLFAALAVFAIASVEAMSCPKYRIAALADTASHPAGLKHVVNRYTHLLGGEDNGSTPGSIKGGRRSINWDADIVPFKMPFDFFNTKVPRGAVFVAKDKKFAVSNPAHPPPKDDRFDSILPKSVSQQFVRFSLKRLFTPVNANRVDVIFQIPAKHIGARTRGFGAVFTDVDKARATSMTYFDKRGCVIAHVPVPPKNRGLSFAGIVVFDASGKKQIDVISRVSITLGTISVRDFARKWAGHDTIGDVVVMDDLFYGEPGL